MNATEHNGTITIRQAPAFLYDDSTTFFAIRTVRDHVYFRATVGTTTHKTADIMDAYRFIGESEAEEFRREKLGWMWETMKIVVTSQRAEK